ncbi:ribosomal protein S12 methylthiotransferase accessory factor [Pseudomonas sp. ok272]|uniref:YcaO-like family protein n=1 Tax=unclassified Pseudomonas TaxID=196821 RepID=UPI0008C38590|nr:MULTISPECIES: YcaO-like family protein [unclassified Pseudomonas]SEN64310.1 ribosomal protein S12 methylthiotransferase accessory factor [Pseudomonas sp. ok272]SFN43287.1 ribosomal protein S12 methylthiotransferase accessory factor [Pseudomonas sp. ok602]
MSEREFSPSEALSRIENIISSLSLTFTAQHADSSKLVATAELFDKNNNLVDSGAGKGPDSLIGALAESIEHLSASQHIPDNITVKHCTFIAKQKAAKHDGFLNNLSSRDDAIDTFKLTTLDNSKAIFVPSLLLCPGAIDAPSSNVVLSSQFLSRYSSNSGTAFGCTQPEALLHGIHEIIERHTLSCFFMAICAFGPTMKLYAPSKALLAASLKNNPSALALADKLQIIIIKDLMNVFFSVALPKKGPGHFHLSPIGSGCSLDICTAV